jgi:hypothetical protein
MNTNPIEFHKSITNEIIALKDRVQYLIGDKHWGEVGRYREAVLKNVIRSFLPSGISLGTGFIIDKKPECEIRMSKQIDIIIYDNKYPVLFSEGDTVITTPENVIGIVEVKTRLDRAKLKTIINTSTNNGKLVGKKIFNGIFAYEGFDQEIPIDILSECLKMSKGNVNHICAGENIFVKYWSHWTTKSYGGARKYTIYEINGFSFTYFLSNLLEYTVNDRLRERWWFQYPIEEGKQSHSIGDIDIS